MPTGGLAGDPLRVAAFIGDAKKADLVGFLAQCGELHAGALLALRTAAGYYGMVQPLRAAAALAAHKRGADPPLDRWVSCAATTSARTWAICGLQSFLVDRDRILQFI